MSQIARAVVRGPMHVFTEVDPRIEAAAGYPMLGLPHCEAFPAPESRCHRELFDWVRTNREPVAYLATPITGVRGIVTVAPLPGEFLEVWWEAAPRPASSAGPWSERVAGHQR